MNKNIKIIEAGHPIPDENSIAAAEAALKIIKNLNEGDTVLFLISGGGSALFEIPADGLTLKDIEDTTEKLLACGADITEINAIRKRLSMVKGGRFALAARPAKIISIILSDVLTDDPATIASGPAYPDSGDGAFVQSVIKKYGLSFNVNIMESLKKETPKFLDNVETHICGSVKKYCTAAADTARLLGYEPHILTASLNCEAREAGRFLGAVAREIKNNGAAFKPPCAVIAGGETVVTVKGKGKGGRNQEIALAAANEIAGLDDVIVFSVSSDGTDGPTNAAGGIVDGKTKKILAERGFTAADFLQENDSYNGLAVCGGLIKTGPTGTNVNDISVILCS